MSKITSIIFFTLVIILIAVGISTIGSVAHELVHVRDLHNLDEEVVLKQLCFVGLMGNNSIWDMGGWVLYDSFEEVYISEQKAHLVQFIVVFGIVFILIILGWRIIKNFKK